MVQRGGAAGHGRRVVSARHTLMIAEMISVGATAEQAFTGSLQIGRDMLESVLLSLHVEMKKTIKSDNGNGYQRY